jgi:hypothetical protein
LGLAREDRPGSIAPIRLVTWILVSATTLMLAGLVISRRGNLGWDDADYLRRGLTNARLAVAAGGLRTIPVALDRTLLEQPKPPLLVGWITLGALALGRARVELLMVHASVAPFLVLAVTVAWLAGRWRGPLAGLLAVVFLVCSPRMLAFGAKVMVETFLGLWVLLALAAASRLVDRPSRRVGIALGLATGLALLTKLTAILLLSGATLPLLWWAMRIEASRKARIRALGWAALACLAVAVPWYARNAAAAVRFAAFSSQFNLVAEGRREVISVGDRLEQILNDLPGWPLVVALGLLGSGLAAFRLLPWSEPAVPEAASHPEPGRFRALTVASTLAATAMLMAPPYFDSRFLLPLWPAVAVGLGAGFAVPIRLLTPFSLHGVGSGLAACLAFSVVGLAREPACKTYWQAGELIDRLVATRGVVDLVNVGNTASWNVCKTGLINELRANPSDCFVIHDLSGYSADEVRSGLPRCAALLVLEPPAFPTGWLAASPGLNRSYPLISRLVRDDPELIRVQALPFADLPPMSVYVRDPKTTKRAQPTPLALQKGAPS